MTDQPGSIPCDRTIFGDKIDAAGDRLLGALRSKRGVVELHLTAGELARSKHGLSELGLPGTDQADNSAVTSPDFTSRSMGELSRQHLETAYGECGVGSVEFFELGGIGEDAFPKHRCDGLREVKRELLSVHDPDRREAPRGDPPARLESRSVGGIRRESRHRDPGASSRGRRGAPPRSATAWTSARRGSIPAVSWRVPARAAASGSRRSPSSCTS